MRIQHNIPALSAYRNLTFNNSAVSKNLEKLSSGYRINRAGDDAAGLAISEKMRAQITGLETAQKNANDGISLIQTAEGALTEVHSMLNRMVELANQSANGTYQDDDRQNLQAEVDALIDEVNRISKSTNFNGIQLLDGSLARSEAIEASVSSTVNNIRDTDWADRVTDVTVVKDGQIAEDPQRLKFTYDLSHVEISNEASGANSVITGGEITFTIGTTSVTLGATDQLAGGGDAKFDGAQLAEKIANANATITLSSNGTDIAFTVKANGSTLELEMKGIPTNDTISDIKSLKLGASPQSLIQRKVPASLNQADAIAAEIKQDAVAEGGRKYAQANIDLADLNIKDGTALKIGQDTYIFAVGSKSEFKNANLSGVAGLENAKILDLTKVNPDDANGAALVAKAAGIALSQQENSWFKIGTEYGDGIIGLTEKVGAFDDYDTYNLDNQPNDLDDDDGEWNKLIYTTQLTGLKNTPIEAVAAEGGLVLQIGDTADDFNQLTVSVKDMSAASLGIGDIDISNQAGAKEAVDKIKSAINQVSSQRGDLGALQNRLEHTINNLSVTTENITAAESRIRDVDMAQEMMAYTKNNILVQASQAMLAQANQIPQGVLQLLQ